MKEAEARFSAENRRVFASAKIVYNGVIYPKPTHIQRIMKEAEARFSAGNRRVAKPLYLKNNKD